MPGLASADPHTLSTLSISRTNGQARSNGLISPSRNMDQGHASEQSRVDHRSSIHRKEVLPRFDMRAAEESLSLYCKPIELYNIIQRRALRNPIFLQRCLKYKIEEARQRRIKLMVSAVKVATTTSDAWLSIGKPNGNGFSLEEQAFQSVLLMLTAPVSSAGMGHSCFRLSQTRVLRTKSANLSAADNKGQPSVTFLLPEIQKLLLSATRDGAVILFITSAELNSTCSGNGTPIESSVNNSGSVLWGSISLTTLCQNWSVMDGDGKNADGAIREISDDTLHVELFPSRLQLVNSMDGRYVNFQSTAHTSTKQSLARLHLCLSVQEAGRGINTFKPASGSVSSNGRFLNCPSLSQARRLQPGQVVFHYHYYFNQLYKSEVTENYSCPFCVRCCSSLKGLRCHLNSTHDLFTFEFLATSDYRLVNVFCRNDVLDPEGNVRDIDGLNDPRLKSFLYWSKCGRPRKSSIVLELQAGGHQSEGQSPDLERGLGGVSDSQPNDPSGSAHLVFPLTEKDKPDLRLLKECPPPQGLTNNSVCQVLTKEPLITAACTSIPCIAVSADMAENASLMQEETRKHERLEEPGKILKVAEESLQALKKQRPEIDDSKSSSPVGHRYLGVAPNGVCLAIAAPRPADKRSLQTTVNAQVLPFKSRPGKHRKSLVERSEARIRFQLQKRQFFHSHTGQPMAIEQLLSDRDSEDENDETIMDLEDRRMLDDFVDVTRDEKELMHLWNSFVRKQRVLADGHCPWACEAFTKLHAKNFHKSMALRRCLMLFLIKLWNHNLVDGNTINRCLLIIDSFNKTTDQETADSNPKS
eukprot:c1515_g1_i1 orf=609-3044(-)